jgi:3,4-dihydroxy 2-butanone 4-phosphate synthase / GTP cyclohydrolase II
MQAIALAIEQLRRGDLLVIPDCGLLAGTRPAAQAAARLTDAAPIDLPEAVAALLDLADLPLAQARLLPAPAAQLADWAAQQALPVLTLAELAAYHLRSTRGVDLVAVADLPTAYSPTPFRAHAFISRDDGSEQIALVAPGTATGAPLVRVHSECLTGDAFGSLRCDCGPQLQAALGLLAASPGGILIYLRGHEGRGIGLANKMRAYALQDQGMDTVEANTALGLPEDARDYAQAAQMLRALGHSAVRLLSNNPDKAIALRHHGIAVTGIEPLVIPANPFNRAYLHTKAQKFGHVLPVQSLP